MHNNTVAAIGWICCMILGVCVVAGVAYYNLEKPSYNEVVLELVDRHNLNPMVFECMKRNWNLVSDYEICKIIAQDPRSTKEGLENRLAD